MRKELCFPVVLFVFVCLAWVGASGAVLAEGTELPVSEWDFSDGYPENWIEQPEEIVAGDGFIAWVGDGWNFSPIFGIERRGDYAEFEWEMRFRLDEIFNEDTGRLFLELRGDDGIRWRVDLWPDRIGFQSVSGRQIEGEAVVDVRLGEWYTLVVRYADDKLEAELGDVTISWEDEDYSPTFFYYGRSAAAYSVDYMIFRPIRLQD